MKGSSKSWQRRRLGDKAMPHLFQKIFATFTIS